MQRRNDARALCVAGALALTASLLPVPARLAEPQGRATAEYRKLDDVAGSHVRLATFPVRPMALDPAGRLWVVGHHDSTVERFDLVASAPAEVSPAAVYGVPWDPVSIAFWPGTREGEEQMLVVCSGTWAIVGLDCATGEIERLIQLRPGSGILEGDPAALGRMSEPADILVDEETHMAFVTSGGADAVLQIDLVAGEVVQVFDELRFGREARMKRPVFLSFAPPSGEATGAPRELLVAPLLSGNNTLWDAGPGRQAEGNAVLRLDGARDPLPDEDLFRISPWRSAERSGSITPIATGVGAILFAHGLAPNGDFWQLCTQARNADPEGQGEPGANGRFASNGVTIFPLPKAGQRYAASAGDFHSLDPGLLPGGTGPTSEGVGQPYALAFDSRGWAFVTGLLSDNVSVLDASGTRLLEWDLPSIPWNAGAASRAIPRGVLVARESGRGSGTVLVYCWGDNSVRQYDYDLGGRGSVAPGPVYALRHDPTPPDVKEGRAIFFDGSRSRSGNLSCATCHVEGGSDFLVWNLSNKPFDGRGTGTVVLDDKGGMFTQTLVGLERLEPFHWRGERRLEDFRPAFAGLLAAQPPSEGEFAKFEAFLLSLANPANRFQNRERVVDDSIQAYSLGQPAPAPASAIDGQDDFFGRITFQEKFRCAACHDFPMGTLGDVNIELLGMARPRLAHRKPTPFHELWRKQQSAVRVERVPGAGLEPRAFLGSGLGHAGTFIDLRDFHAAVTTGGSFEDLASFVHQWDQGLAPAVHSAYLLDARSLDAGGRPTAAARAELAFLIEQAARLEHCDLAVIGTVTDGAVPVPMRWAYDHDVAAFVAEDPQRSARVLADFVAGAASGECHTFLGLPKGMSRRWAIDHDMDGRLNLDDPRPHVPDVDTQDSTAPAFVEPPGSPWQTAKVARLSFRTDEPTRYQVEYWPGAAGTPGSGELVASELYATTHSLLLTGLRPSTADSASLSTTHGFPRVAITYHAIVTVWDRNGNSSTSGPVALTTKPFIEPDYSVFAPGSNALDRLLLQQHFIEQIEMALSSSDPERIAVEVRVDVALQRGGDFTGTDGSFEALPAGGRIVVGRVFRRRDHGGIRGHEPLAIEAGRATLLAGEVRLPDLAQRPGRRLKVGADGPGAPYVVGTLPTGAGGTAGRTVLDFFVPSAELLPGDGVVFVVDAVVELFVQGPWRPAVHGGALVLPTILPGSGWTENHGQAAFTQWAFPDTREARALVDTTVE